MYVYAPENPVFSEKKSRGYNLKPASLGCCVGFFSTKALVLILPHIVYLFLKPLPHFFEQSVQDDHK